MLINFQRIMSIGLTCRIDTILRINNFWTNIYIWIFVVL